MLLPYNNEDSDEDDCEEYYDNLSGESWGTSVEGTWKDLE